MRILVFALVLAALTASPALAEDPPAKPGVLDFRANGYSVSVRAPEGWKKLIDKPVSDRSWVRLTQFQELRTGAQVTLSAQAAAYRDGDDMINQLKDIFSKDATKAILRTEMRGGTSKRPKGVIFEYTFKGPRGAEHALRAYWYFNGVRYRIYGAASEMKWRPVASQIESFIKSFNFTSRLFGKSAQNFTDEAGNFQIYFPEQWTVKLPARGARVIFSAVRDVMVLIHVEDTDEGLDDAVSALVSSIRGQRSVVVDKVAKEGPTLHPGLGFKVVKLEYDQEEGKGKFRHQETVAVHAGKLYRIILRGTPSGIGRGRETYDRIVGTFSFLR